MYIIWSVCNKGGNIVFHKDPDKKKTVKKHFLKLKLKGQMNKVFRYNSLKVLNLNGLKRSIKDQSNYMWFPRDVPKGIWPREVKKERKENRKRDWHRYII